MLLPDCFNGMANLARSVTLCLGLAILVCSQDVVAHDHHHHHHANPNELRSLTDSVTANSAAGRKTCGTGRQSPEEIELSQEAVRAWRGKQGCDESLPCTLVGESTVTIDVYNHIIRQDDGTGGITTTMITDNMNVLNMAFSGTIFQFTSKTTTETSNTAWYNCAHTKDSCLDPMLTALHQGGCADLNVFWNNLPDVAGAATLAEYCDPNFLPEDFVLMNFQKAPGGNSTGQNEGDTL
ncbi:Extracellular metalloprotease [Seminavis robusta]|uniref:Extracellular metalloprotease n=1 Tax=Seminavis robusta TaxID=568900 RepID=A0A9N8EZS9_9STRA|nr:Extracellular metalloprotease [Seminavis robusta]|eukprot:Sro2306_g322730.1 Extracellular metalloprotease (238) ;mRNA; f:6479-7192